LLDCWSETTAAAGGPKAKATGAFELERLMRTRHTLIVGFFLALLPVTEVFAHVLGPDPGVNGIFGAAQTCNQSGCHDSFALNLPNGSVAISGLPASWVAGQTYALTVTIKGPATQHIYGFQLSAVVDASNQQAGTLKPGNGAVQVICGPSTGTFTGTSFPCGTPGAIQYAEHLNANVVNSTYLVNWTAPASASAGTVRFNVAGNAANGDGFPTGDCIYTQVYKVPAASAVDLSVHAFTMIDRGGISVISDGSGSIAAGYARILASSGTTPSGVAIFGERNGSGILITEAGVPASLPIMNGRIYAEVGPGGYTGQGTDIGLAITNPSTQTANITFFYTDSTGTDSVHQMYMLPAGAQYTSFLDQSPWNVPLNFKGTFTFQSSVGVSVVALQLFNNQRGEALITTLPVVDTTVNTGTTPAVLSQFTDGSGWATSVLLVNPTDSSMTGNIEFRNANGSMVSLTANGQTSSSFSYTIPQHSSFKLQTAGVGSLQIGSVTVTPDSGNSTPVSLAVFSYTAGGITLTQAGVPSTLGSAFRMFVEAVPGRLTGTIGSYSTGVAVANAGASATNVTFTLYNLAGTSTNLTKTVSVPPFGQVSQFLEDAGMFPSLTLPFQGVLEITSSSSNISVVGLRIRNNERSDFLMTTTPPTNEAGSTTTQEADFPYIVNAGGYTTQFVLFSGLPGQTSSGNLKFAKQDGSSLNLTVN
jgi:hypothetical protein